MPSIITVRMAILVAELVLAHKLGRNCKRPPFAPGRTAKDRQQPILTAIESSAPKTAKAGVQE